MFLLVAATEGEMRPVRRQIAKQFDNDLLVTGVGQVETTLALSRYLSEPQRAVTGVISFGVAGAYQDSGLGILDLCLARKEVWGDFGICTGDDIKDFDGLDFLSIKEFELDSAFLIRGMNILQNKGFSPKTGGFVTVSCVSGTAARGNRLRDRYNAFCENMEGAAVVRVCNSFGIPCFELRTISNMVEDRDRSKWQIPEAINCCADAVVALLAGLND